MVVFSNPSLENVGSLEVGGAKRSRGSKESVKSSDGSGTLFTVVSPDGRECRICKVKDNDSDYVIPTLFVKWGYPSKNGKNEGNHCYYCVRAFRARFGASVKTMEGLEDTLGADDKKHTLFMALRKDVIDTLVAAGRYDVRIRKDTSQESEFQAVLTKTNSKNIEVIDPEDKFMELQDYRDEHGDPASNGKGHKRTTFQGREIVLMPSKRVFRIKRSHLISVGISERIDSGDVLNNSQLEDMMADVFDSINPERATGVTLDELMGAGPRVNQEGASSSSASSSGAAPPVKTQTGFGFGFGFGVVAESSGKEGANSAASNQAGPSPVKPARRATTKTPQAPQAAWQAPPATRKKTLTSNPGSSGKRGRPRSDPVQICLQAVAEFSSVKPDDDKHFGTNSKVHRRFLERQIAALEENEKEITSQELVESTKVKKQVKAMHALVAVIKSSGLHSKAFSEEFDAKSNFLCLPPVADNPAPAWMFQVRHEGKVEFADDQAPREKSVSPPPSLPSSLSLSLSLSPVG
jgi:hypothetical protein